MYTLLDIHPCLSIYIYAEALIWCLYLDNPKLPGIMLFMTNQNSDTLKIKKKKKKNLIPKYGTYYSQCKFTKILLSLCRSSESIETSNANPLSLSSSAFSSSAYLTSVAAGSWFTIKIVLYHVFMKC